MKAIFVSFLAVSLLAGCVGAGPIITKNRLTNVSAKPDVRESVCPTNQIGKFAVCVAGQASPPSPDDFRKYWGEPKSYQESSGVKRLKYNGDIAWRGLLVFAILPIPLMIPVGYNEIILSFENDRLIEVNMEYGDGRFAICGLHSEGPDPIGCLIWH